MVYDVEISGARMAYTNKEVGGDSYRIRDCYIWAEIHYLDSATDYREYLPQNSRQHRPASEEDLVMLDSHSNFTAQRLSEWIKNTLFGLFVVVLFASILASC